jgi:hypothetical protein
LDANIAYSIYHYGMAETILAAYAMLVHLLNVFDLFRGEFVLREEGGTWNWALKDG